MMAIHSRPMTADELFYLPDDNLRHELVKGELTTMNPAGGAHGRIIMRLSTRLGGFVEEHRLGESFSADTGFVLSRDPDTVRAPDISFVSQSRVPGGGVPRAFFDGAPDLAVEVLSPGDTKRETAEKIEEYLTAGCREVWIVDPDAHSVTIHRAGDEVIQLGENDMLDGGELLPGFTCTVAELFA